MTKGNLIVGLDIGTTKVCAIIGEIGEEDQLEIVGVGTSPSHGVRRGVVVNLDATVQSVTKAIKEAELMAGVEVKSVYAGVAGGHIQGINNNGVVVVSSRGGQGEIRETDVKRVIDTAKGVSIPADREIIHVVPQQYIIDDQEGIKDPVGMSGVRLEAEVHIITGAVTSIQNIIRSINQAGYEVEDIVFKPLAASYATLTKDEKDLGVVLVDVGGGTSDIVVFVEGSVWHTEVLPIGGENITRDISVGLRTPMLEAEEIKKKHGCALSSLISDDETIKVPSVGGRKSRSLPRQVLVEIIEPRM
ncbi:cell division protein FtsA, partial [bacterium]|nr:cell division protein FtsA [bacterium]